MSRGRKNKTVTSHGQNACWVKTQLLTKPPFDETWKSVDFDGVGWSLTFCRQAVEGSKGTASQRKVHQGSSSSSHMAERTFASERLDQPWVTPAQCGLELCLHEGCKVPLCTLSHHCLYSSVSTELLHGGVLGEAAVVHSAVTETTGERHQKPRPLQSTQWGRSTLFLKIRCTGSISGPLLILVNWWLIYVKYAFIRNWCWAFFIYYSLHVVLYENELHKLMFTDFRTVLDRESVSDGYEELLSVCVLIVL